MSKSTGQDLIVRLPVNQTVTFTPVPATKRSVGELDVTTTGTTIGVIFKP